MVTIGRSNLQSKMMPTDKPIIKYKDRKGESYVAREIKLENGYTCAAVFNVKNPSQATLMNHDVLKNIAGIIT